MKQICDETAENFLRIMDSIDSINDRGHFYNYKNILASPASRSMMRVQRISSDGARDRFRFSTLGWGSTTPAGRNRPRSAGRKQPLSKRGAGQSRQSGVASCTGKQCPQPDCAQKRTGSRECRTPSPVPAGTAPPAPVPSRKTAGCRWGYSARE